MVAYTRKACRGFEVRRNLNMNRGEDWEELDVKGCAMPPLDSLEELGLSVTSCCCLKRAGINTIEELCQMTKDDLYKL